MLANILYTLVNEPAYAGLGFVPSGVHHVPSMHTISLLRYGEAAMMIDLGPSPGWIDSLPSPFAAAAVAGDSVVNRSALVE